MIPLPDEKQLGTLGSVLLTNKRIYTSQSASGEELIVSIPLSQFSAISARYVSHSWLPILGGFFLLIAAVGIFNGGTDPVIFILVGVAGVALIIAYFMTRKYIITITSTGGETIVTSGAGNSREAIEAFVNAIHTAI